MNGSCEPPPPPPPFGERGRSTRGNREMEGTQQDETDTNSHRSSGNESNGNESRQSRSSHSSGNGKDSAMLEATESSKSTNSHSLSPPSSSIAYSLLSASSEQDNPSTSGCSSEQSAREKNQKELMKALKELKIRLPSEKRGKGKSGTLATLKYALSCVKQVRANQEYYQQWTIDESQPCSLDMSSFTVEEVESVTSEYTLKNPDTFSVAVSFITGRIVYISDQASHILHCKRDVFKGAIFAEFLAPQDVSVFYGSTAPYHLPSWSNCTSGDTASMDYTQEKSVFCRISGGRERDMNLCYHPFRFTPYLMKVRDSDNTEGQLCCLLIAEKIHSGYEAPRIPPDKRIFTTRHTPSCVFQEVDERAVPLLGYLPQDLIGMPVLFFIHPEDRPLMLAIHKKVLQQAGQPFDHFPIRMCARSGEYVTIDTSWSSFVNPWSRKVSFILGRHKVRTSPLNDDVLTAPKGAEMKPLDPDILELSEQIHRILMQPVHNTNYGGNGSGGSNISQEPFHCNASSSDSNAMVTEDGTDPKQMTFQEFCQNVHKVKSRGQKMFLGSRVMRPYRRGHFQALAPPRTDLAGVDSTSPDTAPTPCVPEELARKGASNYSYQQINCLESIIRYLESCNRPSTVKRKCGSSSYTSSTSEEEKQKTGESKKGDPSHSPPQRPELPPPPTPTAVGSTPLAPLPPLPPSKAESVVSVTSQASFSSTIVHVGDKKPPDLGEMVPLEEPSYPAAPTPLIRPLGLTKEVLSAHTQREEQAFLTRVHSLSQLRVFDPIPVGVWDEQIQRVPSGTKPSLSHNSSANPLMESKDGTNTGGLRSKSRKSKAKRPKQGKPGSPSSVSTPHHQEPPLPPPPPGMTTYPLPMFPPQAPVPEPTPSLPRYPLVTPIVALVLPNYLFQPPPVAPPFYPGASGFSPFNPTPEAPTAASEAPTPSPPPAQPMATSPPSSPSASPSQRLFPSRCSSPLQLDLLQMEELPQPSSGGAGGAAVGEEWEMEEDNKGVVPGNASAVGPIAVPGNGEEDRQPENCMGDPQESSSHNDALSSSSDLLDLLLHEDSCSGTGSAASGSMGSNGGSTSACGTRSSESSNTSKYFGSIDSSETDLTVKKAEREEVERKVIRYVMQDPLWLLMANADHEVMMSYQLPSRDLESVLQEDREKLRQLQRNQPKFSEEQKRELGEVHAWVRKGRLPHVINIRSCTGCSPEPPNYEEDLDLSIMMEEEPTAEATVIG